MCACERQQDIAAEEGKKLPGPTIISRIKSYVSSPNKEAVTFIHHRIFTYI